MANSFNDYLASFSPHLKITLRLLDVFDRCFYTLITGSSVHQLVTPSSALPVSGMNMTEKVRLKSIIERTRLHIVKLADRGRSTPTGSVLNTGSNSGDGMDIETGDETDIDGDDAEDEGLEIEVAKVYNWSLVQIGGGFA